MSFSLKILTYNIAAHYTGFGDYVRMDQIRAVLVDGDWDIICLNEVYNKTLRKIIVESKDLQQKYPHQVYSISEYDDLPIHTFDNGLVILSKHSIVECRRYEYKGKLDGRIYKIFSPKDVIFAEIDFEDNPVHVFFTHLQWGDTHAQSEVRMKHFEELRAVYEDWGSPDIPTIICGDMNIYGYPDRKSEYKHLMQQFPGFKDWHMELYPTDPAITWSPENAKVFNWFTSERLDYILGSHHFVPTGSTIHKFKRKVGLYIMKWQPTDDISILERLSIELKRILRIPLFLPLLGFHLVMSIYRIWHGFPQTLFIREKDLSDHYALEGQAKINTK